MTVKEETPESSQDSDYYDWTAERLLDQQNLKRKMNLLVGSVILSDEVCTIAFLADLLLFFAQNFPSV